MSLTPIVIPVHAASRSYEAVVGAGVLGSAAERVRAALPRARSAHVFLDDGVPGETGGALSASLGSAGLRVGSTPVRATEDGKSLQTVSHMVLALARNNLERGDVVVALGGGIVGDMAGFAAASYRRGIAWVNCPTTLLAMVDASVGGKTGVNLRVGDELQKNMVGAFWQPSLVLADVAVLASLAEREFRAGLAECIKHAMLGGVGGAFGEPELMAWTKASLGAIGAREPGALTELVARNLAVKAVVVGGDEREDAAGEGGRALLNLGHTFGHAIETITGVAPGDAGLDSTPPLRHGEAVALGLVCAARCAEVMKLVGDGMCEAVKLTLRHARLPTAARGLPESGDVYERMLHDKKAAGGKLRLVLPVGVGICRVVDAPSREIVMRAIDAIRV